MPGGDTVQFGYERDLDVSILEKRGDLDHPTPDGWTSSRVLCRSGQSTLSCLLHLVTSTGVPAAPLTLHHAGRYFESKALLDVWPRQVFHRVPAVASEVDVLLGEPVFCDGRFGVSDPRALPRARRALLLDTTLVGAAVDLSPWFDRFDGPLVAVFRSGLKLDQAGLELANVGIAQLFERGAPASRPPTPFAASAASPAAASRWTSWRRYRRRGSWIALTCRTTQPRYSPTMQRSAAPSVESWRSSRSAVTLPWSAPAPKRRSARCACAAAMPPPTAGCWKSSTPKSGGADYALPTAARSAFAATATN